MKRSARALSLAIPALVLALPAPAWAGDGIEGVYRLLGQTEGGERYEGEARIHRDGDEYVLSTTFADEARSRPQARSHVRTSYGAWRFALAGGGGDQADSRGAADALEDLLGGDSGRRAGGAEASILEVVDRRHCLLARLTRGGELVARERLIPRADDGQVAVTVLAPRRSRFQPHRPDGPNTVRVSYRLEPRREELQVTLEVSDREGRVVHSERRRERAAGEVVWDGRVERGYADARRSPYTIRVRAQRAGAGDQAGEAPEGAAEGQTEVTVVPLVDAAWVVSRVGAEGPFTSASKIAPHGERVVLTGVVRAIVAGVRAADPGRTERAYYLVSQEAGQAGVRVQGLGAPRTEPWDVARWGVLNLEWETIHARGLHSPAYRETQNARRMTRHGEFTNVVSNGDEEGRWLGRDVLEYEHRAAGVTPELEATPDPGTLRYRFDVDHADPALDLPDEARAGTFGARNPRSVTSSEEALSGLYPADYSRDLGGISGRVHRISRRGASPNPLLSYLECYRGVPWLYGSLGPQAQRFIGYDCADLAFAAARHAGLTRRSRFTNANNLCRVYTRAVAGTGTLRWSDGGALLDAGSGEELSLAFGGGEDEAQLGDIVFFDWDGDGKWDHTTILWANAGGRVTLDTQLVWAHHDRSSTDGFYVGTIRELVHPSARERIKMRIRRF